MQTTEIQPATNPLALVSTATRTDGVAAFDDPVVANTFVTRASFGEQTQSVEEDSTDIYLLERCSPLNDF